MTWFDSHSTTSTGAVRHIGHVCPPPTASRKPPPSGFVATVEERAVPAGPEKRASFPPHPVAPVRRQSARSRDRGGLAFAPARARTASVPLPQAGGRKLEQMVVRIAEVDADAAPRPLRPALQGDAGLRQM